MEASPVQRNEPPLPPDVWATVPPVAQELILSQEAHIAALESRLARCERRQNQNIDQAYLLLVEGQDEVRFWEALLKRHGRTDIQVMAVGGRDQLLSRFRAVKRDPKFDDVRWLGVVQDADQDPDATFRRIHSVLQTDGLPIPAGPWERAGSSPEVVAFVLPDGTRLGDLETLVWEAVQGEPAIPCINSYFECLQQAGISPRSPSKARVHAYLASRNRPDRRLGEAADAGDLPLDSTAFERFLGLLPTA